MAQSCPQTNITDQPCPSGPSGGCDITLSSGSVNLSHNTTYCFTGNVTVNGDIPSTTTIYISSSGTMNSQNVNSVEGEIINCGVFNQNNSNYGGNNGFSFHNYGTMNLSSSVMTLEDDLVVNYSSGIINAPGTLLVSDNAELYNLGSIEQSNPGHTIIVKTGSCFYNGQDATVTAESNFVIEQNSSFLNYGVITAEKDININTGANITNECTFHSYDRIIINGTLTNNGLLLVDNPSVGVMNGFEQLIVNKILINNKTIVAGEYLASGTVNGDQGQFYIYGATTNNGTFSPSGGGTLNFYDETNTNGQVFDQGFPPSGNVTSDAFTLPPISDLVSNCGILATSEICGDGIDNDGDGYSDCFDEDCACYAPWVCDNTLFQTMRASSATDFILYDVNSSNGDLTALHNLTANGLNSTAFNSLAYNTQDNFLYGINNNDPYTLSRINALGEVENLGEVSGLIGANQAGAMDGAGNYYVTGSNQRLFKIDINTLTAVEIGNMGVSIYDIAVSPVDNKLYGWAQFQKQLVRIDPNTADITFVGQANPQYNVFGALYFNAQGSIIAYGDDVSLGTNWSQETLVVIDPITGVVTPLANNVITTTNDGASCAFGVALTKDISSLVVETGEVFTYTFEIYNFTDNPLISSIFSDVLPMGFTFASEPYLAGGSPFVTTGGPITGATEANLTIPNVATGITTFYIDVEAPDACDDYINQAMLSGLGAEYGDDVISDYPVSPEINDPTPVTVVDSTPPTISVSADMTSVCHGSEVNLTATVSGGSCDLQWQRRISGGSWENVGDGSSTLIVDTATLPATGGSYQYRVEYECNPGCGVGTSNVINVEVFENPEVTVSFSPPACDQNNGEITFTFPDNPTRTAIKFSIDGGTTFTQVGDNSGSYTITDLPPGVYDLWVRWGDHTCPVDLEDVTLVDLPAPVVECQFNIDGTGWNSVCEAVVCEGATVGFSALPDINSGYSWVGPNSFTADTRTFTRTGVTADMAGTYTVTYIDGNGCSDSAELTLTVNNIEMTAGPAVSICIGETASLSPDVLSGTPPYVYSWTGPGGFASDQVNPVVDTEGTYTLEVTDALGCMEMDEVEVYVNDCDVSSNCNYADEFNTDTYWGSDGTLSWSTYGWDESGDNNSSSSGEVYVMMGTLVMKNGNGTGPSIQRAIDLTGHTSAHISLDFWGDGNLDSDDSFIIEVYDGTTWTTIFSFSGAISGSHTPILDISAYIGADTEIRISIESGFEDMGETLFIDNVRIYIDCLCEGIADAGPDVSICYEADTQLSGSGGDAYEWSPTTGLSDPLIANPIATPTTTTTYVLTVTDEFGCEDTDEVVVSVNPPLVAIATAESESICPGETSQLDVVLKVGYSASGFSYINSFNPNSNWGGPENLFDNIDNTGGGTFHARRDVGGQDWGIGYTLGGSQLIENVGLERRNDCCTARALGGVVRIYDNGSLVYESNTLTGTGNDELLATPTPNVVGDEIRYIFPNGINTQAGNTLNFSELNIYVEPASYTWSPAASLSDASIANPIATPDVTTTYTVTVTDDNGCSATDEVTITVYDEVIALVAVGHDHCLDASGSATVTVTEGEGPFTINWENSIGGENGTTTLDDLGSFIIDGLNGGSIYCIEVLDANGCKVDTP